MREFGERFRKLRVERGYSRASVAKALGVSASLIGLWETDRCDCSYSALIKSAKFFGVSCDYLLGLADN